MKGTQKDILLGLLAVVLTAGLIVGGYFLLFRTGRSVTSIGRQVWIDDPAPEFTLERYGDGQVSLTELKGHPLILNFFSVTCTTCQEELPAIVDFYRRHHAEVMFFAISTGDSRAAVAKFVEREGPEFPLLIDETGEVAASYGITGVPETVFIDREGIIRHWIIGAANRTALEEGLKKVLGEGS